jgi:uncharacterized protein (TIGR00730 family)
MRSLCVFCGSHEGGDPAYATAAAALGGELAARGIRLVFGGGRVGLMGVVADAVLRAGGQAVGVIPTALAEREVAHLGLTELHQVRTMHERKALMADLSDAFLALPGGIGTLEELFEVWTWRQIGFHAKPCALLNVAGFYDRLLGFLDLVGEKGFLHHGARADLLVATSPADAIDRLAAIHAPAFQGPPASVR